MKKTKRELAKRHFVAEFVRSVDEGADENKIDLVFSTGHKGLRQDWNETYYEELVVTEDAVDLSRLNAGAPFLAQHSGSVLSVLGVVERAWIEDGKAMATIRFSKRSDLKDIVQDIKDGILRNVSVGYRVLEFTDKTQKNDKYRTLSATKWQPMEISSVAIGFDPTAQTVRSDDTLNEVEINEPEAAAGPEVVESPVEPEQSQATPPHNIENENPEAEKPASGDPGSSPETEVEAARCAAITLAATEANLSAEETATLLARNLSVEESSNEIFKILELRDAGKTKTQVKEPKMKIAEKVIQALMYRANSEVFKCSEENELKGKSLIEIFEAIVPRQAGEKDNAYAQRAVTTADLQNILVDASNKIIDEYTYEQDYAFRKLAKPQINRDFLPSNIVDIGTFGLGTPATEGGDYPEASLDDSKEKLELRQRGVLVVLSPKAVINDDLKVLSNLPDMAQNSGFEDLETAFFNVLNTNPVMLTDAKTFFHVDHDNLIAVASGVDVASMDLAEQLLASQTKLGKKLKLKPKYILVAPKYALAARRLVGAQTSTDPDKFNPYAGTGIEVIVSAELTDPESWYVFADPKKFAAIRTGVMEGMEVPRVAVEEQFRSSSLAMKVEFHNNAAAANAQGVVKLTIVP